MKISEIGEFGLIAKIAEQFKTKIPEGCHGIGDDCAVIPISDTESLVVTTDMLVEDVHFLRSKITPFELGYKSLAVNLSDIAAMGASPHSSFMSIALTETITTDWCDDFFKGYRVHDVVLLGGDTTRSSDKLIINITAIGIVKNTNIKFRSGSKIGDKIYVTDFLGNSAGGLKAILNSTENKYPALMKQHNTPRPHMLEGEVLGSISGVNSMMDISDGLASDLRHILRASNVGAEIELTKIPISSELANSQWNALELALTGGEDYCLLFTVNEGFKVDLPFPCYEIGTITDQDQGNITWIENGTKKPLNYNGFSHF